MISDQRQAVTFYNPNTPLRKVYERVTAAFGKFIREAFAFVRTVFKRLAARCAAGDGHLLPQPLCTGGGIA